MDNSYQNREIDQRFDELCGQLKHMAEKQDEGFNGVHERHDISRKRDIDIVVII